MKRASQRPIRMLDKKVKKHDKLNTDSKL